MSPVYNEMAGLCPLYVSVSEHEVCLDEDKEVIDKADFLRDVLRDVDGIKWLGSRSAQAKAKVEPSKGMSF